MWLLIPLGKYLRVVHNAAQKSERGRPPTSRWKVFRSSLLRQSYCARMYSCFSPRSFSWASGCSGGGEPRLFPNQLDHRLCVRIFVHTRWRSVWVLLLHRLDRRPGALHCGRAVHGFSLVHLSALFKLLSRPGISFAFGARAGQRRLQFVLDPKIRTSWSSLLLTATFLTVIDVIIDPVALRGDRWFLGRIYGYPDPGVYFGIPLMNFVGWAVVGVVGLGCTFSLIGGSFR